MTPTFRWAPPELQAARDWLLTDPTRWGNLAEAWLWFGLAGVVALRGGRRPGVRSGAAWLVLFSGSDLVEMFTGAWWEPLWLFFWKAACVVGLAASYGAWRRSARP